MRATTWLCYHSAAEERQPRPALRRPPRPSEEGLIRITRRSTFRISSIASAAARSRCVRSTSDTAYPSPARWPSPHTASSARCAGIPRRKKLSERDDSPRIPENHISDHDLERYRLGMVGEEADLAPLRNNLLGCPRCVRTREQTTAFN